ncbi:MAG: tetratricopeptide repeat protein [Filomicrobium sp.]
MIADRYYGQHSTTSPDSVAAFEDAVFAVAAHRPALTPMKACLGSDPDLIAGLALKGLGSALLGKSEDYANARQLSLKVNEVLAKADGGTRFERTLGEALGFASTGHLKAAARRLEAQVSDNPRDFLCLKLANAFRFMTGEPDKMLATTSKALRHIGPDHPGYGFTLGLHSFGLEETGSFRAAEETGRRALDAQPADTWAVHSVAHVMEMSGRTKDGAEWLTNSRPLWPLCNNFGFHLAWHLALFHIEEGRSDIALDLYDREVRPTQTDDFRDMSNAVSMLWRLEQHGVNVGNRWTGLREIAYARRTDTSYVFASLHYLLALIGAGDLEGAGELVNNMRIRAAANDDRDQARVADNVGIALAEAFLCLHGGRRPAKGFGDMALEMKTVGGSHAQRDVFMRTLMISAAEVGSPEAYAAVKRVRSLLKQTDQFNHVADAHFARRESVTAGSDTSALGLRAG